MILPIIGIRLQNKNFVPLIDSDGNAVKCVKVYKSDFFNKEIPIYICKMQAENKVEKIYKIGQISVKEEFFKQVKQNQNDDSKEKCDLFINTKFEGNECIIEVIMQNGNTEIPLKRYTANVINELEERVSEEREDLLLDYGNFVKCQKKRGYLLPEFDLTQKNAVKEKDIVPKDKKLKNKVKTKGSLVKKINAFFVFSVILSLLLIVGIMTYFICKDVYSSVNKDIENFNRTASELTDKKIKSVTESSFLFCELYKKSKDKGKIINSFFNCNSEIGFISLPNGIQIINENFVSSNGIKEELLGDVLSYFGNEIKEVKNGKTIIKNTSHIVKMRSAVVLIPVLNSETNLYEVMAVLFSTSVLNNICDTARSFSAFIIDDKGFAISGTDFNTVMNCQNICELNIVNDFINNPLKSYKKYFEYKNEKYVAQISSLKNYSAGIAAYKKLTDYEKYYVSILIKIAYCTAFVLILILIIVTLFSKSIVKLINRIRAALERAVKKNFYFDLKTSRRDEIGALANEFNVFCEHLNNEYSGKEVSENSIYPDKTEKCGNIFLNQKGETKISTVLVFEIKNFNMLTRGLSASETLNLLNEYVSEMEKCIKACKGHIFNVSGSKISAIWGLPGSDETPKSDALNAVRGIFRMKYALVDYNSDRGSYSKPGLNVAFGLHSGTVVSGQIDTENLNEYVCVGGTVSVAEEIKNYASESDNEIIISEDTYLLVSDAVEAEKVSGFAVTEQKDSVSLYSVEKLKK